jgi:hypothetical protein
MEITTRLLHINLNIDEKIFIKIIEKVYSEIRTVLIKIYNN